MLVLPACALVAPRPRRCSAVTCDAKSKKKDKAPFKPPPLELSRPVMVLSRRESHEVVADAREREAEDEHDDGNEGRIHAATLRRTERER